MDDFKRRICAQTSNYTSLKRFFKSQINPKIFSAILHSQFNYHTLLVLPLKMFLYCWDKKEKLFKLETQVLVIL